MQLHHDLDPVQDAIARYDAGELTVYPGDTREAACMATQATVADFLRHYPIAHRNRTARAVALETSPLPTHTQARRNQQQAR